MSTMKEVLEQAREVYEKTMCGGAGCCGDFKGTMEYIDGAVGELVQKMANLVADELTIAELTRVGVNGWGDVVLFCEVCGETYAQKIQTKTLRDLWGLKSEHKCDKAREEKYGIA